MEHYRPRPNHRDKHRLGRRDYFKHRLRCDGFPGIDLDGATLEEIRGEVRGRDGQRDNDDEMEECHE